MRVSLSSFAYSEFVTQKTGSLKQVYKVSLQRPFAKCELATLLREDECSAGSIFSAPFIRLDIPNGGWWRENETCN